MWGVQYRKETWENLWQPCWCPLQTCTTSWYNQHTSKEGKSAYFHKHIGAFADEFDIADPHKEKVTQHELLKKRSNLVLVTENEHN